MKKIALVEDNPDNRMLLVALLEDEFEIDEYEMRLHGAVGRREFRRCSHHGDQLRGSCPRPDNRTGCEPLFLGRIRAQPTEEPRRPSQ